MTLETKKRLSSQRKTLRRKPSGFRGTTQIAPSSRPDAPFGVQQPLCPDAAVLGEALPDRETFAKLVTPFSSDLETFHRRFLEDRTRYAALDHFDLTDVPPNTFDVSCLPWVRYRSFDMHIFDSGTYLAPVVTWGKYEREGDRTILPVSLNIHHAVADGFHLSRFFLELQELLDAPEIS